MRRRVMRSAERFCERRDNEQRKRERIKQGDASPAGDDKKRRHRRARRQDVDPRDDEQMFDEFEAMGRDARRRRGAARDDASRDRFAADPAAVPNALVLGLTAGRATVWRPDPDAESELGGTTAEVELTPALARVQQTALAVGDEVVVEHRLDGTPRVVAVAPRRSHLSRPDPGVPGRQRVLVANVDVVVVVLSVVRPALRVGFVDRVLVALARAGDVQPVLCVNKLDLLDGDRAARAAAERELAAYAGLELPVVWTSAASGAGIDALRAHLDGSTSAFVGHSGVGKSALLNRIDPDGERATGHGRAFDGKGRHTTRGATLRLLDVSTRVIDTAGVRSFGLWNVDLATLRDAFPDLEAFARLCRYRDCRHVTEPECAVRTAVERGEIPPARHAMYRRLLGEVEQAP